MQSSFVKCLMMFFTINNMNSKASQLHKSPSLLAILWLLVLLILDATSQEFLAGQNAPPENQIHLAFILDPHFHDIFANQPERPMSEIRTTFEHGRKDIFSAQLMNEVLTKAGADSTQWIPITLANVTETLDVVERQAKGLANFVVINLCDGCETDGYPGISVVRELQKRKLPFTGADEHFYEISTSKIQMKRRFMQRGVPTSPFVEVMRGTLPEDIDRLGGYPLIVKPSVSYGSVGITSDSVVFNANDALLQANRSQGAGDGILVERFLKGREFTALVYGDANYGTFVFEVIERVFNSSLEEHKRLLSFQEYWGSDETEMNLYEYARASSHMQHVLKNVARNAFLAINGSGYGRVDMRTDSMDSDQVFVLEVNANCELAFEIEKFISPQGEILKHSKTSMEGLMARLISHALHRHQASNGLALGR